MLVSAGPDDAEDLVAESFHKAYFALRDGDLSVRNPRAWLLTIARRTVIDGHRRKGRRPAESASWMPEAPSRSRLTATRRGWVCQVYSSRSGFAWPVEEGDIKSGPMARMKQPHVPEDPPAVLSEDELKRLLATCERGSRFEDRRDAALIRVFIDTGARRAEAAKDADR